MVGTVNTLLKSQPLRQQDYSRYSSDVATRYQLSAIADLVPSEVKGFHYQFPV